MTLSQALRPRAAPTLALLLIAGPWLVSCASAAATAAPEREPVGAPKAAAAWLVLEVDDFG